MYQYKIKTLFALGLIAGLALFINACKEVNPTITPRRTVVSTTYIDNPVQTPEPKNVLVEMITGVTCPNCSTGHDILNSLIAQNNGHVVGIEYHGGPSLSIQLDNGTGIFGYKQNMTSADALTIVNAFVYPGSMPVQSIDRVYYPSAAGGNGSYYDSYQSMAADVAPELTQLTQVNVNVSSVYSNLGSTRQINIGVGLHYTTAQTDTDLLSIFLTEDSIISSQEFSGRVVDTNYVHMHIMRAAVTAPLGDQISVPDFSRGRADTVNYTYTIPVADSIWKPTNMHVIAFVNQFQHGSNYILQSKMTWVTPH